MHSDFIASHAMAAIHGCTILRRVMMYVQNARNSWFSCVVLAIVFITSRLALAIVFMTRLAFSWVYRFSPNYFATEFFSIHTQYSYDAF